MVFHHRCRMTVIRSSMFHTRRFYNFPATKQVYHLLIRAMMHSVDLVDADLVRNDFAVMVVAASIWAQFVWSHGCLRFIRSASRSATRLTPSYSFCQGLLRFGNKTSLDTDRRTLYFRFQAPIGLQRFQVEQPRRSKLCCCLTLQQMYGRLSYLAKQACIIL